MRPDLLKMKEVALIYLDRSGGLQKFVDDCKRYNDSKQSYAVYRFIISINPSDIAELDAALGNQILHKPMKAAQIFQSVCFIAIKTLSLIEQLQTEAQINIVLKPTHLPPLPSYVLSLCEFPLDYISQRFYMSEGIVIAMGTVTKYTQGARFLCSEETCPFSEDKQLVEMIDAKALSAFQGYSNNKPHFRIQSFTVFLRDELSNKMKIGNRYRFIGIPACIQNCSQFTVCIEVNSMQLCSPEGTSCISENFKYLLSLTSSSCWRFTAMLATIFASQVVPPGTYNTLKLSILLSLVQTCDRDRETADYLDLLIVTSDTLIADRLLNYSVCLVARGIRHPASNDIFPTVSKDKHGTGTASIQACSALLAKGGICFIGDLLSHKKDKLELLQSVLESRTTTVFIPGKKYGEDVDQQVILPIQTSFWTFVDEDLSSKKYVQMDNTLIGKLDLSSIAANLIDAFGLLIHCNELSCQPPLPLFDHIMKKAIDPEEAPCTISQQFRTQDYEELIVFAKNLHVELSSEAERLIHGYYLASRRVRTDSIHGSKLSTSALKILVSLSKAHTKLSLRKKVLEEDVLIAVLLFESSLTLKHGASVFCVAPNAVFPFDLIDENTLQQRDVYLMQCYQQLLQFIATYSPGTHVTTNEE
ncbi:minichromosome maintenance domain-containing protein 2 isoform X4 [Mauremys mutica]|uniref:minichromosome maintenance domain-containing protein 2 isoform X4 n=1 Tax=Mauremys mutica TaxID=74926 RepID=UPI001D162BFB|nr:minichromosome maintenance domain-containing protein 2 isoform X4 [Mauremys mutica]